MLLTTQQCILTHLLDCGYCDLEMLEDINYDLDEILDDLVENNDLSLNSIFREVFRKGARDLKYILDNNKEDIENWINEEIQGWRDEAKGDCISDNPTNDEIDAVLKNDEEYQQLLSDLNLIQNNNLNPEEDLDYYCNCLDTYVYMKNIDFYKRWIPDKVYQIENNIGWEFESY